MRKRLIELIKRDNCRDPFNCSSQCKYIESDDCHSERLADLILADGWIRPPCKVGDTIWFIKWYEEGKLHKPISRKVQYFSWSGDDIAIHFRDGAVMSSSIGEIAFLIREEAEQKLQEGKG